MSRNIRLGSIVLAALLAVAVLWPAQADAQRRSRYVRVYRPPAVVHAGVYYRSYYDPFYWQRYPYPYPYRYGYWSDYRSDIRIQGTPKHAQVYVDGYFVGVVDDFDGWAQRLRLEPGEYEIAVYLEGYRTRREPMLVRPGQSYKLQLALEPLAQGEPAEPRPTAAAGRAAPGRPADRPANRPPARNDERALGTLSLRVQPSGAIVLIDGERWDWPEGEPRLVVDVPEGAHRIEVQRQGHRPYSSTVDVRRGEVTTLNISLPRQD